MLFSYALRASLADLHHWLQELHDAKIDGSDESNRVRIALAHILGKIKGNSTLNNHLGDRMIKRIKVMIDELDNGRPVQETARIAIYSEIRESIATLEVENHLTASKE